MVVWRLLESYIEKEHESHGEATVKDMKELEELLERIPPVHYVAAGSCGVKYVSKGLEIICCRAGKAEFTTLASGPLDNKVYQSLKCRFHKNCWQKVKKK